MKYVTGAMGAAILASSHTYFNSVQEAVKALTQIEKIIKPEKGFIEQYNKYYHLFITNLVKKGYIRVP
jgi:sugar (pentulose or hexulose) kinase